jgi:hypothetical protein
MLIVYRDLIIQTISINTKNMKPNIKKLDYKMFLRLFYYLL